MKQTGIGCVSISSQSCRVCVCCRFLNYESKTFNVEIREEFKVGDFQHKFNSQVGVTSHLVQKAIYCFILTRRRTAEISVLPTLTAPSTPGNVWLYLQTFEKKSQVKYANVNYCIEGTMTLTCSVICVSSCPPVRRGTPPAPPATRHLSRVVRNCLLKVILEMLDLFIT